jgi:phosphatidyl-myo-inositol alpha-mannosyltransferase
MRVLHIVNGEHLAGPERVVDGLVRHARVADPVVVALMDAEYRRSTSNRVQLVESRGRADLSVVPRLARLIRRTRADIVHTHTLRANLVGRVAARLTGRIAIDHVHSPSWLETTSRRGNRLRTLVDDATRRLSRQHIAVSSWLRDELVGRGYPPDRVVVCPNGVEVDAIAAEADARPVEAWRHELGLPAHAPLIGMYAMFRARKGAEVLLRAFALSVSREQGARLLLVGGSYETPEGPYLNRLRSLADDLGISEQCHFVGHQRAVVPWMAAATVGVVPSLFGEGMPMTLLEQLAAGLPTVATRLPGISEVAGETHAVELVPVDDPAALAAALDHLIGDAPLRAHIASRARSSVARFSAKETARCVEVAYENVMQVPS